MAWKNGGGTTTEIVVVPADGSRFTHRLSIADVAHDGPFSRFAGYDRHIMLVSGAGMVLDCGVHGRISLAQPLAPRSFSGDWEVHGTLLAGPCRDFNLIVDRAHAASSLDVVRIEAGSGVRPSAGSTYLHVLEGSLGEAGAGDTIALGPSDEAVVARTMAVVARAAITPRASGQG